MRIGLFLGEPRAGDPLTALVDLARQARDDGFASVWAPQIFGLDALTALAVVGREVDGVELATGVVPVHARHPSMLAQQALTTALACGGRLVLGIGLSHQLVVEHLWGLSFEKPARYMEEYVAALLPLLREGRVSFSGDVFRVNVGTSLPPQPFPVLLAALGPRMLRLAGAVCDGTVTWMTGVRTLEDHVVPTITKAAEEAGREPRIVQCLPVCVTDDADAGRELAARVFAHYGELPSYRAMLDREGAEGPADVAIVGDEAEVRRAIERSAEAGATDFVAVPTAVGDDLARTRALLKTLL